MDSPGSVPQGQTVFAMEDLQDVPLDTVQELESPDRLRMETRNVSKTKKAAPAVGDVPEDGVNTVPPNPSDVVETEEERELRERAEQEEEARLLRERQEAARILLEQREQEKLAQEEAVRKATQDKERRTRELQVQRKK